MSPRNLRLGLCWYGVVLFGALCSQVWAEGFAMASVAAALFSAITFNVLGKRKQREVIPGSSHYVVLGLLGLATACALLGTFAATSAAIKDYEGTDHSIAYGVVCAIALIFGYRALIKRSPRSIGVLALFTHVVGFVVVIYSFMGRAVEKTDWFAPIELQLTPAALAMYGLLATTAAACGNLLIHSVEASEDDQLADVPAAHVVDS